MRLKELAMPLAAVALAAFMGNVRAETTEPTDEELKDIAETYNESVNSESKEVVCEWVAHTGSRIKEKQCRTKAQIKRDADEAKRFADKPKQSYKSN